MTDENPNMTRVLPNIIIFSDIKIFNAKINRVRYEMMEIMVDELCGKVI